MTTNCIIEPRNSYAARIFTTGEVGWSGVGHVAGGPGQAKDFSAIIKAAQVRAAPGWPTNLLWHAAGCAPAPVTACPQACARQRRWIAGASCCLACRQLPQEAPGFTSEPEDEGKEAQTVLTGFARNAVLGVAGEVIKAVQEGHLKHIFLIGEGRALGWPGAGGSSAALLAALPSPQLLLSL